MPPLAPMTGMVERGSIAACASPPASADTAIRVKYRRAAQPVLHVVTEHQQEVQIHQEMPDALVQEERGREGQTAESPQMGRDETEGVDGLLPEPESAHADRRDQPGQAPRRPRPRAENAPHFHRQAAHEPDQLLPAHIGRGQARDERLAVTLPHGRTLRAGPRGGRATVTLPGASPSRTPHPDSLGRNG